jgi:hypothetical protein
MKLLVKLMPMFGQNPHHFGRNKDIDLTKTTDVDYPFMQLHVRPNRPVRFVSEPQLVMPARVAAAPQRTAVF